VEYDEGGNVCGGMDYLKVSRDSLRAVGASAVHSWTVAVHDGDNGLQRKAMDLVAATLASAHDNPDPHK